MQIIPTKKTVALVKVKPMSYITS